MWLSEHNTHECNIMTLDVSLNKQYNYDDFIYNNKYMIKPLNEACNGPVSFVRTAVPYDNISSISKLRRVVKKFSQNFSEIIHIFTLHHQQLLRF